MNPIGATFWAKYILKSSAPLLDGKRNVIKKIIRGNAINLIAFLPVSLIPWLGVIFNSISEPLCPVLHNTGHNGSEIELKRIEKESLWEGRSHAFAQRNNDARWRDWETHLTAGRRPRSRHLTRWSCAVPHFRPSACSSRRTTATTTPNIAQVHVFLYVSEIQYFDWDHTATVSRLTQPPKDSMRKMLVQRGKSAAINVELNILGSFWGHWNIGLSWSAPSP